MSYKAVEPVVLLDENDGFLGYKDQDGHIKQVLTNVGFFTNTLEVSEQSGFIGVKDLDGNIHWICNQNGTKVSFKGEKGEQGIQGPQGPQGPEGPQGVPGLGLLSFENKTDKDGIKLIVAHADGHEDRISVPYETLTPIIGENGNWFINSSDTNKPSRGETGVGIQEIDFEEKMDHTNMSIVLNNNTTYNTSIPCGPQGPQGEQGEQGPQGESGYTPIIGDNGNWYINGEDTGYRALGSDGSTGTGINNITSENQGPITVATITLTDGNKYFITIPNGKDAEQQFTDNEVGALKEHYRNYEPRVQALENRIAALEQALQAIDLSGLSVAYPVHNEQQ